MNTAKQYEKYKEKCKSDGFEPIGKKHFTAIVWSIHDMRKTEPDLMAVIDDMCAESLSPTVHDKWEDVKDMLYKTRKQLKGEFESL